MNSYIFTETMLRNMKEDEIKATLKNSPFVLELLSDVYKNDKEIVLEAVKANGDALQFASKELKGDKDVVLAAITSYPRSLMYAHKRFRDNDKVRTYAFRLYGGVFIVDPIAWEEFKYRDASGFYRLEPNDVYEYEDNSIFCSINNFQKRFARFYGLCDDRKMTPWELKEFEEKLLQMRKERLYYRTKNLAHTADDMQVN